MKIEKDFWTCNLKYRAVTEKSNKRRNPKQKKNMLRDLEIQRKGKNLELVEEDYKENDPTEMAQSP